jgi:hypothetical protein
MFYHVALLFKRLILSMQVYSDKSNIKNNNFFYLKNYKIFLHFAYFIYVKNYLTNVTMTYSFVY